MHSCLFLFKFVKIFFGYTGLLVKSRTIFLLSLNLAEINIDLITQSYTINCLTTSVVKPKIKESTFRKLINKRLLYLQCAELV